jgi:GDPmannose 4,6-dehydratase
MKMKQKKALITGITGQDGSFLAELLLSKGYQVFGLVRRVSTTNTQRIDHLRDKIVLLEGDMGDQKSLRKAIRESQPNEVYNLAAQSFVAVSWDQPEYTMDVNGLGCMRLLEAIRQIKPDAKFYQASSSELFGKVTESPQNENTRFHPRSPYGIAKLAAYWYTANYRESYDMFTCNGILYNHESERRGLEFVTRKITNTVAKIKRREAHELVLGNLDAKRDWGYAKDYVKAMWLMLQQDKPDDYVISTGVCHSVKDFVIKAFQAVDIANWQDFVKQNPKYMRPADVELLCGDCSKAKRVLGWEPKTNLGEMIQIMVDHDLKNA